jgi:ABC-type amino acid transport substrate-binding protein
MKRLLIFIFLILGVIGFLWTKCSTESIKFFIVARDPSWSPLILLNKEPNVRAFSDELLNAIATQENIEVRIVADKVTNLLSGLDNKNYDGILTSILPAPQFRDKYLISENYLLLGPVLIVRKNSTIASLEQMENKTLGILRGSSIVFEIDKYPSMLIVPFGDPLKGLESLMNNNIDGMIIDILPAYGYTHNFFVEQLKIATPPLTRKGLHLISRNDAPSAQLNTAFNQGLKELKTDGKYNELIQRWDLINLEKIEEILDP